MIVTVNCNTSLDYVYFIPAWNAGETLRASRLLTSVGGKPTNVSWILSIMGIPSRALGFAAGLTGSALVHLLTEHGIATDYVTVAGESRRNLIIADAAADEHTAITTDSLIVTAADVDALRERYIAALDGCEVVMLGGSLPGTMQPDFYTEFIGLARERGIPVIFDAGEPNLSAGLKSQPTYIKPNRSELAALVGKPITTIVDAYHAGREIVERCGTIPVISLGGDGGLAVLPDRAYRIPPLRVPVVNAAGAGDAVVAGLTASIYRRLPLTDGLRLGFAAASAVVTTPGTAECTLPEIERYAAQIEVLPYEPA